MEGVALIIFRDLILVFSGLATALSLIFMLWPSVFKEIEELLGLEIGAEVAFSTVLEGRIMVLHNWVYQNHAFFGPAMALVAAWNTRNAYFFC